ncbi:MAG: NAD(P)/FAD-dependent oxidoreductase [Methanomicrobiales archaeon]|nr:NAD(P)/FAD-dependent oxidoreductase [Methanomicrobiales archaeon]
MRAARSCEARMIVVIGGGPAGRLGAIRLAHAGKEVLLLEKKKIGGQCLHHGCMVVCALSDAARWIRSGEQLQQLGIASSTPAISFSTLIKEMQKIQGQIEAVLDEETRQAGVEIQYGVEGRCEGEALYVDGEQVPAEAGIIATGSRPIVLDIPGRERPGVITPHTLGSLETLPLRLTIIGGGIMSAEFAYAFSAFGSEVTIIARSGFLRTLDPLLRRGARTDLEGVIIRENTPVTAIERSGGLLSVRGRDDEELSEAEVVLMASGLRPNAECARGLRKGDLGEIVVDDHLRTSVPGIYAAGDVAGPPYLTPVARMEGMIAADNILGKERQMDYRAIPQSISLSRDFMFCGEPSEDTAAIGSPAPAGPGSFWAVPSRNTGTARLMIQGESGELEGVRLIAPGGSLIGAYLSALIRRGCTVTELEDLIEVHPNTDGILPLIRYMGEWNKKRKRS